MGLTLPAGTILVDNDPRPARREQWAGKYACSGNADARTRDERCRNTRARGVCSVCLVKAMARDGGEQDVGGGW